MTRGVATRLGIDYPACRQLRDDIIYCNTYAYGLPDPLGRYGGLDPLYQASSGIEYEAGAVHLGNTPLYLRFGMCDASNAMLSVVGILLALVHRQRTGEGQELWTSLHDGGVIFSSDVWVDADGQPWDRAHLDQGQHGLGPGYRVYRTQDDGWICVAAVTPEQWAALCRVSGHEELLTDPALATPEGRRAGRSELEDLLSAAFRTHTALWWNRALDDAGVPNEIPLESNDGATVLHDADNVALGLVTEQDHPTLGRLRMFGRMVDFSATPSSLTRPPPLIGQHSRDILREVGYRDGDIDALIDAGTVYQADERYGERFAL
jgi:crotonobetainyl-CoA:carnitine CoA-transferase CaiB-like acyl-CoA transferase